jgi:hypothetical protein
VGADHLHLVDTMRPTISLSGGTVGDYRAFAGGSIDLPNSDHLLAAAEFNHLNGPWDHGDHFHKLNGALRWSRGTASDGISLTALGYSARWHATTDQPLRAIEAATIGRYGTLDPSDGGRSARYSLSGHYAANAGAWAVQANAYVIHQRLTLWNDFTHFLDDPVAGDQHAQNDRRTFFGGTASASRAFSIGGITNTLTFGLQGRYDAIHVDLIHTQQRVALETIRDDRVKEGSIAAYAEDDIRWTPWLRSVFGLREDAYHVDDRAYVGSLTGAEHAALFQPKGSLILGPWAKMEFYVSAGRGFHSNDGRAGIIDNGDGTTSLQRPPLLVRSLVD